MTQNNRATSSNPPADFARRQAKYQPVYDALHAVYGDLEWRLSQSPMDELVSCILSQNTNDNNRDRAFEALQARYKTWQAIVEADTDELIDTSRPAGLANQNGPRIQRVLARIHEERGAYDIEFLRDMPQDEAIAWLTSLDGVGPKTAAIVLCFGFGLPAFPVDTHVHRLSKRIGFIEETVNADKAHTRMEAIVPPEDRYAFHIYLIRHGREICQARKPACERCPITAHCDYYRQNVAENKATDP